TVVQTADNRPFVHDLAAHRQQVAQADSRNLCWLHAELALVLSRSIGLRVPHVDVAGAATHPQNYDGCIPSTVPRCCSSRCKAQQVCERNAGGAQHARFQEAAPIQAKRAMELPATDSILPAVWHEEQTSGMRMSDGLAAGRRAYSAIVAVEEAK